MPTRKEIVEHIADGNPDALLADGFEGAYIGICRRASQPDLAAYDYDKCIEILVKRDKMSYDEAREFFEFNTVCAWVGEHTPVFITKFQEAEQCPKRNKKSTSTI